ncbi:hypothetical protein CKM354_001147400 [Cercospora kikuchii]|uniref:Uncharacterized protein n=1 Tax=Cercospora kikuchii TaxID=84275 RepID=A0A9P3CVK9_9PEZI|nr:uncharacterized protein CKM354_001147400 [Cercospora kikuchii]GIZ48412.1 hypothetical protein CKM354_001147400 [Cercospora kikuchii]
MYSRNRMPTDAEYILESLPDHRDGKVGYVVFRVTYGDNARWEQFIERLKEYMGSGLEGESNPQAAEAVKAVFELDIRDNEAELKDASKHDVRAQVLMSIGLQQTRLTCSRIFNAWVESVGGINTVTKYNACIYADEEVVESVLEGEDPRVGFYRTPLRAYVKILDIQYTEETYQYDSEDEPDEAARALLNSDDDGYDPIEGCRSYDVGWVKAAARLLIPRTYAVLCYASGWDRMYVRPPALSEY